LSKSIKLKNNVYLDTSSIVHNKELLTELLSRIPQEVVVFEGKIYPGQTKNLDFTPYKRIIISFAMYDAGISYNTGGSSNICMLELTDKPTYNYHKTQVKLPYIVEGVINSNSFIAEFYVSPNKDVFSFTAWYGGSILNSSATQYYVSKIVGVK